MPVPPVGHSSSIDSNSSFNSSNSSLLAPPIEASSQSDISDQRPLSMPRSDTYAYGIASSPSQAAFKSTTIPVSAASATQKFKRAFGKRRRPSQDAATLLSSGDERSVSDAGPSSSASHLSSSSGVVHSSDSRPSTAKLTMHLFGGRKLSPGSSSDSNLPPPLPPKPTALRPPAPPTLLMPSNIANKLSSNGYGSRPRSSIMATSPSINAAIEFMREEDEERQRMATHRRETVPAQDKDEIDQNKEDWRKSDSTVASGHTVRPPHSPDSGPGAAGKRLGPLLTTPPAEDLDFGLNFLADAPPSTAKSEEHRQPVDASGLNGGKQSKRRSLSLNIHVPARHTPPTASIPALTHTPTPSLQLPLAPALEPHPSPLSTPGSAASRTSHSPSHTVSVTISPRDSPTLTRTEANGIIASGTASGSPVSKTNIRGRLAAWTAASGAGQRSTSPFAASTSTPSLTSASNTSLHQISHRRVPVMSNASQPSPELQAVAAVRELPSRTRSPSAASSSGAAGIRQAATSLTSGAGAMALGLGKRAYEKVGRVWGGSSTGSGSGSDTPSDRFQGQGPMNTGGASNGQPPVVQISHGPSAFPPHSRRTPNAPSGTWSVSSLGGSRSSSEKDPVAGGGGGRETPSARSGALTPSGPGRLIRPPRSTAGGVVFGRELWECVRETRAAITSVTAASDPLVGRMIPALVLRCAQHLHKWGIEEEGLFRISGRSSHINKLRQEFDSGADYDLIECSPSDLDPHAVASVFKAYLRELPEPILTRALASQFDAAMNTESSRAAPILPSGNPISKTIAGSGPTLPSGPRALPVLRKPPSLSTFTLPTFSSLRAPSAQLIESLGNLVARLPRENRDLLQSVVELMKATAARSKDTKMPLSNLLLVFCPSLSMGPTLLRVLCDAPGIWEQAQEPPVMVISRSQMENEDMDEDVESYASLSDSDSASASAEEDQQMVELPPRFKGKGRETPVEDSPLAEPSPAPEPPQASDVVDESQLDDSPVSPQGESPVLTAPLRPRPIRRVPVPALLLDDEHLVDSPSYDPASRSQSPFIRALPQSDSTPSLEAPSRSSTPVWSPPQSAVSLKSAPDLGTEHMVLSPRTRQFSSPSPASVFIPPTSWAVPNQDKDLPASPRSPGQPVEERYVQSSPQLPQPLSPVTSPPERTASLPTSHHLASRSAPSVVFPSAKTAPTTPTSLQKHALTLSLGRNPKRSDSEDLPSPSKRVNRRPSLNMLFNIKRGGSPSPRSRTPTISSPISIVRGDSSVELSPKTVTNTCPPVLSLPIEGSMDVGLGWDDVFGQSLEAVLTPPHPRPTAISQPSSPPPLPQSPPSPVRRPTTEYLLSSGGFFNSAGPLLALPSATAVLEAAEMGAGAQSPPSDSDPAVLQEDSSSGPDSPAVNSPAKDAFSPPHLSFQLRRSSMEEDWASAVLMAAGKPTEPVV